MTNSGGGVDYNRDKVKSHYLRDIFSSESNPDDFEYGTGRTANLMLTGAS